MEQKASSPELVSEMRVRGGKFDATDRELWSHELDWWLNCRDAACGYRSSFAAQVAAIERGNATSSSAIGDDGLYVQPYHDGQVGIGPVREAAFAIDRKMVRRWRWLAQQTRDVLFAHYTGACPVEVKGRLGRSRWALGIEARLGRLAGVAVLLSRGEKLAKVLAACERGDDEALKGLRARADTAIRTAHAAYYEIQATEAERYAEGLEPLPAPPLPRNPNAPIMDVRNLQHQHRELNFGAAE
jgi:hypothetical protein